MTPTQSRKQILIVESDLNRAHLIGDLSQIGARVRTLRQHEKPLSSFATSAAVLIAGLNAFRSNASATTPNQPPSTSSRLQSVLKYAGLASTLWLTFRNRRHSSTPPAPAPMFTPPNSKQSP